jgi:hypothetical protein
MFIGRHFERARRIALPGMSDVGHMPDLLAPISVSTAALNSPKSLKLRVSFCEGDPVRSSFPERWLE